MYHYCIIITTTILNFPLTNNGLRNPKQVILNSRKNYLNSYWLSEFTIENIVKIHRRIDLTTKTDGTVVSQQGFAPFNFLYSRDTRKGY